MSDGPLLRSSGNSDSANELFVSLLLAHQKRIYGFILTLVSNFSDADDVFQETAMTMCRKFEDFETGSNFFAWSIQIARYCVIGFRRKQSSSYVLFSEEAFERVLNQTERMLDKMDARMEALQKCITQLNDRDSQLIKMRYEKGIKINVIAEKLGRSVQGLYKVFARIHDNLRKCIRRKLIAWETA